MAKVIEFPKNASAAVIERGKEIGRKLRELIKSKLKAKQP